MEYNKTFLRNW